VRNFSLARPERAGCELWLIKPAGNLRRFPLCKRRILWIADDGIFAAPKIHGVVLQAQSLISIYDNSTIPGFFG
jgi:hypothetical protein